MSSFLFKLILLGDGAVGKTSLRKRYTTGSFTGDYLRTMGTDFALKRLMIDDTEFRLQIWDIAGQTSTRFTGLNDSYFFGASGAILVFDVTRPETLDNLSFWIEKVRKNLGHIPMIIFGNKIDLRDQLESLEPEQGEEFAQKITEESNLEIKYYETSAKTGENVEQAFFEIAKNMYDYCHRKRG
ncbi:MAG: GTP-binding protein [Candidatus Heimdallarchaeota archaeon]|nr:GTP-binding protein [Candidatus Heimdallarchaeota archaeon]